MAMRHLGVGSWGRGLIGRSSGVPDKCGTGRNTVEARTDRRWTVGEGRTMSKSARRGGLAVLLTVCLVAMAAFVFAGAAGASGDGASGGSTETTATSGSGPSGADASQCGQTGMETVATDAADYAPGLTVHITGSGYGPACDVTVKISRPDGVIERFAATTDLAGNLAYDYLLPPPPGVIGPYQIDVLGLVELAETTLATMTFTDAGVRIQASDVSSSPTFAWTTEAAAVNQVIYARTSNATVNRSYKLELLRPDGSQAHLSACQ